MDFRKFNDKYIIRLEKGEDIVESLTKLVKEEDIKLGKVTGIGAVNDIEIGLFHTEEKKYYSKRIQGDMEIVSLAGNISTMEGEKYLHLHIAVGDENLEVYGGHLNAARVSATVEIMIDLIDGEIDREFNEEVGLNLIKFKK